MYNLFLSLRQYVYGLYPLCFALYSVFDIIKINIDKNKVKFF